VITSNATVKAILQMNLNESAVQQDSDCKFILAMPGKSSTEWYPGQQLGLMRMIMSW